MKFPRPWQRSVRILAVALLLGAVMVLALRLPLDETHRDRRPEPPKLFGDAPHCSTAVHVVRHAKRLEMRGRLHAERYPYDPQAGVVAVLLLREAEGCYRRVGLRDEARRIAERVSKLATTVQTDYASSRLALETAIERERWSGIQSEVGQLLRFTAHLKQGRYLDWLEGIAGKAAARAGHSQ